MGDSWIRRKGREHDGLWNDDKDAGDARHCVAVTDLGKQQGLSKCLSRLGFENVVFHPSASEHSGDKGGRNRWPYKPMRTRALTHTLSAVDVKTVAA